VQVVVSPNPAASAVVKEEHFFKSPVVKTHSYVDAHNGQHVQKTYAEAGVSVRRTHVDEAPTTVFEKTFHDGHDHEAHVFRTTVIDPEPVVHVEKQVHAGLPVLHATPQYGVDQVHRQYQHVPAHAVVEVRTEMSFVAHHQRSCFRAGTS
jgi:hypothetical protein